VLNQLPRHRTVADVMTTRVHVANPQTPFKLLVRLLDENRIRAVPIVDLRGMPLGVVSETDLLLKERHGAFDPGVLNLRRNRREQAKADGLVASDLMTAPAITVSTSTSLAEAARTMHDRNVRRLVVVDERGRIAGIVTRSDLLQVFLRSDEDLREDIVAKVIPAILVAEAASVDVDVRSNVVTLAGEVDRRSDAEILTRVTREMDGVVGVVSQLTYRWDDTSARRWAADLR
jgi:CBS-domain-containing membrane protein